MARYIDADRFKNNLIIEAYFNPAKKRKKLDFPSLVARVLDEMPTADVVPKSEVDKLKIEIEALKIANEKMYEAFGRQAREIFEEIEKLFFKNGVFIHTRSYNKLKKKYTEEE